jgi:predicted alpha/beta-hydrolase family hydrolase
VAIAVLAPGYGGSAQGPILRQLGKQLEPVGVVARSIEFSTRGGRPSREYATELTDLRRARDDLLAVHSPPVVLIGRSFGGRMCAFLAEQEPPDALVILGYPIAPPNRPRPRDEATLAALKCPTLVVQGDMDELGPLAVLERIAAANRWLELAVIAGAGHDYGRSASDAIARSVDWVKRTVGL